MKPQVTLLAFVAFCVTSLSAAVPTARPEDVGLSTDRLKRIGELMRQRLYLETMERVLASTDKVIIDSNGGPGVVPYLPLDQLQPRKQQ